jgi:hypothetical protein
MIYSKLQNMRKSLLTIFICLPVLLVTHGAASASAMPDYERLSPLTSNIDWPISVALGPDGTVYAADAASNKVVILSQGGRYLSSLVGMDTPISVAVDQGGRLLVGNKESGNVEVYDTDHALLFKLGSGDGEFAQPNDICIDGSGLIYVVDRGLDTVRVYDSGGSLTGTIGTSGNGDGQFHRPVSMTIDEAVGEIIVLDRQLVAGTSRQGARVQYFDMTGTFLRGFSRNGTQEGGMVTPQGITVDRDSRIYVTDSYQNAVLVYDSGSNFLGAVYDLDNPLRIPLGIAMDETNRLRIASRMSSSIEVYGIGQYVGMDVDPVELEFAGKEGMPDPPARTVSIRNSGTALLSWSTVLNVDWLRITDEGGVLEPGQTAALDVAVDTAGLAPGEYIGSFTVSAGPGAAELIRAVLRIEPSAKLSVSPSSLSFTADVGSIPAPAAFTVANAGQAPLQWSISVDQSWIGTSETAGFLAGPGTQTVTVTADVTGLAAGTYSGTITVNGQEALGSPAVIDVSLTLTDPPVVEPPGPADRVFEEMTWNLRETIPPISLNGVWTAGGADAYAVGQAGTILRLNSDEWSVMASPSGRDLNGVWGSVDPATGTAAVFAVGAGGTVLSHDTGVSEDWTLEHSGGSDLTGVWGASPTDVYAVGRAGTILHYNGTNWSAMDSGTGMDLYAVWGSSAADADSPVVYAAGERGTILVYAGSSWQQEASPTRRDLYGLWGSSSGDVYAVGRRGIMLHNDGSGWRAMDVRGRADLNAVWGSSASDIHAVGANGTILHYDGGAWSRMRSPVAHNLHSVWGSPDGVFAVGRNLSLLYYDGTAWQALGLMPSAADLHDVWGRTPDEVYAVGRRGTILEYDGSGWEEMESPTGRNLYAVWGREHDIFAVGEGGTILSYGGGAWKRLPGPTGRALYDVWGAGDRDVFAVGLRGTILHSDGTSWEPVRHRGRQDLYGIWGRSATDIYMVGQGGSILHYDGLEVRSMPSPARDDLYGIRGCPDGGLFAVGRNGTFLQQAGRDWISLDSGTGNALYDVWCSSESDVFLVGQDGTFLYYDGAIRPAGFETGARLHGVWGSMITTDIFAVGSGSVILHGKQ